MIANNLHEGGGETIGAIIVMKNIVPLLFILLINNNSFGQSCNIDSTANQINGKTIETVIDILKLDSSDYHLINEPPGVIRGITGIKNDLHFFIYVERTCKPLLIDTTGGNWTVEQTNYYDLIKKKKISAIV